jgi:hypothetical protein
MKKIILASVTFAAALASMSAGAATATVCAGGSGGTGAAQTADTSTFVKVAFNPKCSANVHLTSDDNQTYYRVGAASVKGKNGFGGSTAGGAVSPSACAATGCTSTDATAAMTNASST